LTKLEHNPPEPCYAPSVALVFVATDDTDMLTTSMVQLATPVVGTGEDWKVNVLNVNTGLQPKRSWEPLKPDLVPSVATIVGFGVGTSVAVIVIVFGGLIWRRCRRSKNGLEKTVVLREKSELSGVGKPWVRSMRDVELREFEDSSSPLEADVAIVRVELESHWTG
jgi:hypothetical protein